MDNTVTTNSIDITNIQQVQPVKQKTLSEELTDLQDKWVDIVKELNEKLKTLHSVDSLLNEVYTKRQEAVDTYYGTGKILADRNRDFKAKAATLYVNIKSGAQGIRYTNEGAITLQIEAKLSAEKETIDALTNFTNYMKDTIQSIDNIIYGINNKIKVYEMLNGMKF